MTYKLKEHVTSEMLMSVGFYKSLLDPTDMLRGVEIDDYDGSDDNIQVYIPLEFYGDGKVRYVMNNYGNDKLIIPYIQDLIEKGWVEEV